MTGFSIAPCYQMNACVTILHIYANVSVTAQLRHKAAWKILVARATWAKSCVERSASGDNRLVPY